MIHIACSDRRDGHARRCGGRWKWDITGTRRRGRRSHTQGCCTVSSGGDGVLRREMGIVRQVGGQEGLAKGIFELLDVDFLVFELGVALLHDLYEGT